MHVVFVIVQSVYCIVCNLLCEQIKKKKKKCALIGEKEGIWFGDDYTVMERIMEELRRGNTLSR